MTSIIGIKCEKGLEGIVVVSDLCGTQTKIVADGPDFAHYERRRNTSKKLYVDSERKVVIGNAGQTSLHIYSQFLSATLKNTASIKKATEKTHFLKEIGQLNAHILQSNPESTPSKLKWLIATRYNALRLFQCNEDGNLEELPAVFLGSGAGLMYDYFSRRQKPIPSEISIPKGIELGFRCLKEAFRDPYTSGRDLIVVTKAGIDELGAGIRKTIAHARRSAIQAAMNLYREGTVFPAVTTQVIGYNL